MSVLPKIRHLLPKIRYYEIMMFELFTVKFSLKNNKYKQSYEKTLFY